ncbi:carboxymuconolactone decarboxylase family protein [Rhizobium sp. Leaf386]|uniref:carboxymuconolactone decarboxylase family protein n=1 Tax=Rhizobium sp. Leaf386 TaxID=1736359 RepID=UPI000716139B|nr:carboxymuconolactone decarboxylase family protein [Rhizobium sp. Leaf386]KQT02784.1 4-carboxymuconolactone decarboxylase [Rhizobium sp. Leaf386]
MRLLAAILSLTAATHSSAQTSSGNIAAPSPTATVTAADIESVSPALNNYIAATINGDLWKRPELSPRDRSIVVLAILISTNQAVELKHHLRFAMDNGVTPKEISEIITHLAFYSGVGKATAAVVLAKEAFAERGIGPDQIPPEKPHLLPLNQEAESARVKTVAENVGPVSPGLEKFTTDLLFTDLWLRPDLAPRDRSLVTVSALIANGQVGQVGFHLNKAADGGLTKEQAGEVVLQAAFYGGWPNAFSAVPVVGEVFKNRKS